MNLSGLLLLFMLAAVLAVVLSPRLIYSLIALTIFSSLLTIQYVLLKAPDVAITEAALGAGLSTLVYLTAIRKTAPAKSAPQPGPREPEEVKMIHLPDYLKSENLVPLQGKKREQIIQEIIGICLKDSPPGLTEQVSTQIINSKKEASPQDMNLGKGFALVHAREEEVREFRVVIGLLPAPRKLYKKEPIHTVIGIVLPSSASRQYLAFLARFGRLMYSPGASEVFAQGGQLFAKGKPEAARAQIMEFVSLFEEV